MFLGIVPLAALRTASYRLYLAIATPLHQGQLVYLASVGHSTVSAKLPTKQESAASTVAFTLPLQTKRVRQWGEP